MTVSAARGAAWYVTLTVLVLAPSLARAESIDPVEVMRRVQRQDSAADEQAQFSMRLVDASGQVRRREGVLYTRQVAPDSLDQMRLIRFHSPADLEGSGVLTIEHPDRANDQWLYLPAYHTTRRIVPANRGDRYMGTDFLYEDIMREKVAEYRYRMTGEDVIGGVLCLVLEAVPVAPAVVAETAYSKRLVWIDPARDVIRRVDYHDRDGRFFKRLLVSEVETVAGRYRWREVRMEDFARRHATLVTYHGRRIEAGVPARYFTEQYLKQAQ